MVITRGRTAAGITQLVCSLIVSPIIYFIGLAIFGAVIEGSEPEKASFDYGAVAPSHLISVV